MELELQLAWGKANAALLNSKPDVEEVIGLVAAKRHCAARSSAIGFASGERELLRMARYVEGRLSQSEFLRSTAD